MDTNLQRIHNVKQLIGKGGFGDVYRAFNTKLNRFEAVKVSHPDQNYNIKLIKYEAGILNHMKGTKGVPQFYEYSDAGNCQILKMEYLGNDLDTILRQSNKISTKVIHFFY